MKNKIKEGMLVVVNNFQADVEIDGFGSLPCIINGLGIVRSKTPEGEWEVYYFGEFYHNSEGLCYVPEKKLIPIIELPEHLLSGDGLLRKPLEEVLRMYLLPEIIAHLLIKISELSKRLAVLEGKTKRRRLY